MYENDYNTRCMYMSVCQSKFLSENKYNPNIFDHISNVVNVKTFIEIIHTIFRIIRKLTIKYISLICLNSLK